MTTRHEFLRTLHMALRPKGYLEIGVQFGHSLSLCEIDTPRIVGVDPDPHVGPALADKVMRMTSDEYFDTTPVEAWVDLAFIDGMHLIENALRDFIGVEQRTMPGAVVVFDDVLPYTALIAGREPLPGDWTGDVWKLWPILLKWRPLLELTVVDVEPTGLLVVQGLDPADSTLATYMPEITQVWAKEIPTPHMIVDRAGAYDPTEALDKIMHT